MVFYIYARDMAKNCPRYIPDMPEIRASFARGVGIQIEKVGQPGRVHKLGHYVAGEVHNAVGHFVVGTKCLLTFPYLASKYLQYIG